jgi:hypothetical protein
MKKFGQNKYILIFIGFILVSYIFYVRIILVRLPKDFTYNKELYLLLTLLMSIFFSILLVIKIYKYVNQDKLLKTLEEVTHNKFTLWFYIKEKYINVLIYIKTFIESSLFQLDNTLIKTLPFSGNIVEYIARLLLKFDRYSKKLRFFKHIVSILIALIFIFEITLFLRLNIFYKILMLLLIPLIINYIIYSNRYWYQYQINGMNEIITVELTDFVEETIVTPSAFATYFCMSDLKDDINFNIRYKTHVEEDRRSQGLPIKENLVRTGNYLLFLSNVLFYLLYYDNNIESYNKTIYSIVPTILYTIGWVYIFIYVYYGISIDLSQELMK